MRMKFGIDIDGTVTRPDAIVPFLNEDFGLSLTLDDIYDYDLSVLVDIPKEQFSEWWLEKEPLVYERSPLAKDAKRVLKKWEKHHDLYYISARSIHLLEKTQEWFTKNDLPFHKIELVDTHDKVIFAKKYELDIFFEDKHDNAVRIHEQLSIPVILFNTPYNQDSVPKGVIRVNSWAEAEGWVDKWLEKQNA